MNTVWLILKFIIYTYVLVILYRQSYNFLFFIARRPMTWIGVVGFLGISNMGLAYMLGWDPRLVSAAVITALLFNIAPSPPAGHTKEEMGSMVNEIYKELGLPHGRIQSKIGLAAFGLRIPTKPATDSEGCRPGIPKEGGRRFRRMSATAEAVRETGGL